jgi:peptidoglycan/LPS O-acetylase OafA/YrhL
VLGRFDLGVAVFFALSGYLLYGPFVRARESGGRAPSTRVYLLRRAVRVLPLYWLVLVVVVLAVRPGAATGFANLFLVQIYVPETLLESYTQTWSLATEVAFYAVLPLLAVAAGRARRPDVVLGAMVVGGWLAAGLSGLWEIGGETLAPRWLPAHLSWFAVGMLVAEARDGRPRAWTLALRDLAARPGTCGALAAGAFLLATTEVAGPLTLGPVSGLQAVGKEVLGAVVAGSLLAACALGTPGGELVRVLGSRVGRYLGQVSYGVFLWHLPVLTAFYAVTDLPLFSGHLGYVLSMVVPATLLLSTLTFHLVEQPLMRWSHRGRLSGSARKDEGKEHGNQDEEPGQRVEPGGSSRQRGQVTRQRRDHDR